MLVCKFKSTKYSNADIAQPIPKLSLQKCNHNTLHKLSNKSVLNLGYKGNGALTNLGALKEYLPKNVKNVIWFYFTNDVWDRNGFPWPETAKGLQGGREGHGGIVRG